MIARREGANWVTAVTVLALAACAHEGGRATLQQFHALSDVPAHGTMKYSDYCGIRNGRASLVIHEMSISSSREWTRTTWWIPEAELDGDLLRKLSSLEEDVCE